MAAVIPQYGNRLSVVRYKDLRWRFALVTARGVVGDRFPVIVAVVAAEFKEYDASALFLRAGSLFDNRERLCYRAAETGAVNNIQPETVFQTLLPERADAVFPVRVADAFHDRVTVCDQIHGTPRKFEIPLHLVINTILTR